MAFGSRGRRARSLTSTASAAWQATGRLPVGRGIGPALEAWDLLAVLQRHRDAPTDLRERALLLAGGGLEPADRAKAGEGCSLARATLGTGHARAKFQSICAALAHVASKPDIMTLAGAQ